ncbi:MAG: hypothetical protein RL088_374 [Verrucomicrobiota bacterium]|jgi:hypothetical protein
MKIQASIVRKPAAVRIEPLEGRIAPAFGAVLDLASLTPGIGLRLDGSVLGDDTGVSVANAGDVNNDGISDFIIGAPLADDNGNESGVAYVIFGKSGGLPPALSLPPASASEGFKIRGVAAGDRLGTSVSGAGDVNNDGVDDVLVGAPFADGIGAAYVIYGGAGIPLVVDAGSLTGADGFKIGGDGAGQQFGVSVSRIGDLDGDGFGDVVLGAPGDDSYGTDSGAAYVVYGAASFPAVFDVGTVSSGISKIMGDVDFDLLGASVASAGDVNKDGNADLVVGAPGVDSNGVDSGSAYVLFGSGSVPGFFTASGIGAGTGFEIRGAAAGNRAGSAVAGAGDLNGDSFGDVVVGAPNPDGSGLAGTVAVVFGAITAPSPIQISGLNGSNGFTISGLSGSDRFGLSVSAAGDVNGDGISDLIAAAYKADTTAGAEAGAAYVVYGKTGTFASTFSLSSLNGANGFKITGAAAGELAGRSVSRAGDVDGDGIEDFLVGASGAAVNGAGAGAAYLIFGQPMTDIDISIVGGALAIDDTLGADSNASMRIVRSGADVLISDPSSILNALSGVTQIDAHTVRIPFASITGPTAFDAGSGDDTLTLDFSGGPLPTGAVGFIGGDGIDAIFIEGDTPSSVLHGVTSSAGSLIFNSYNVTYDSTESVTDLRAVGSRVFTATDDTDHFFTVSDHGSGVTDITSESGFLYRFASPATLLSVNGGAAGDTIQISSYDAPLLSQLTLTGGVGTDTIKILSPLRINRLDLDAEVVEPLGSVSLGLGGGVWTSSTTPVSFAAGATLGLTVAGSEAFLSSSVISVNGALDLSGLSLRISGLVTGPVSQTVPLIENDGTDPVVGAFDGLPEGGGVMLGTVPYVISYLGGDGNDVYLKRRIAYGSSLLGDLNGTNGFVIGSAGGDERLGSAVSMIGDINGDGFDDFAVAAPRAALGFAYGIDAGATYVIFGKETPFDARIDVSSLDGSNGFVIRGVDGGDLSGSSVSGGGDINGDGLADIVIGATQADPVNGDAGAVYAIFGKTSGFGPELSLSALDGVTGFRFDGGADGDLLGVSVNASGDINGDGLSDVVIGAGKAGADSRGRVYVLFGSRQPFGAAISESSLNGTNGFVIDGEAGANSDFGAAVAAVDVNGDGFDDIVAGAPSLSVPGDVYGTLKGAAYVIFGAATQKNPATSVTTLNGKNGFKMIGKQAFSSLGFAVGSAGDFNDDGIDDLIIGAPGRAAVSIVEQPGAAYVVFGKAKGWTVAVDIAALTGVNGFEIIGSANTDLAGSSVGSVGDFNGDGISDVIIGAPDSDASGSNKGAAHVLFGRRSAIPPQINVANINGTNGYSFLGSDAAERAGLAVAGIGDINRDGFADIAVGSPFYGDDGSVDGRAYVVFGKAGVRPMPSILGGGTSATFLDVDGDEVVVKVTGGKVNADMFTFDGDGNLLFVDLNAGGTLKRGANISFLVTPRGGDGLLNVGAISGSGLNLGRISVTGDLGQIDISPLNPLKPALKQLVVGSLGMMGEANQIPGTIDPLLSEIGGSVTKVLVKRNIQFASLVIGGSLGNITINGEFNGLGALNQTQLAALGLATADVAGGGTLANSGLSAGSIGQLNIKQSLNNAAVQSGGNIGSASVGGSVNRGAIVAGANIGVVKVFNSITSDDINSPSVIAARGRLDPSSAGAAVAINAFTVRGNVTNAEILIGYDSSFNAVNPDAGLGKLTVRGNWTASSLTAGIADGGDDGFGRNDTTIPEAVADTILARIASIVIVGTVSGTAAGDDSFAITAERISKVKIGTTVLPLDKAVFDDILVDGTDDFRIKEIAR